MTTDTRSIELPQKLRTYAPKHTFFYQRQDGTVHSVIIPFKPEQDLVLGSSPTADIPVPEPGVLPEHTVLRYDAEGHLYVSRVPGPTTIAEMNLDPHIPYHAPHTAELYAALNKPIDLGYKVKPGSLELVLHAAQ